MTGAKKGVQNPKPRVRDVAGLKEEMWTRTEGEESSRTAENAAARCIAVEAVGSALQQELMGGARELMGESVLPRELTGGAPILGDGVPLKRGIVCSPDPLPISVVRTILVLRLS